MDLRLAKVRSAAELLTKPTGGWIRSIREALGMSLADLAQRAGIDASTLSRIESNEIAGKSNLETLERMAAALDCDLVYALVPRSSLQGAVEIRAREVADSYVMRTQQTMAFEEQGLDQISLQALRDRLAAELVESKQLWRNRSANV